MWFSTIGMVWDRYGLGHSCNNEPLWGQKSGTLDIKYDQLQATIEEIFTTPGITLNVQKHTATTHSSIGSLVFNYG